MLIYPENADLGRTERKPGAYFTQATQTENLGSETELGLETRPTRIREGRIQGR